MRNKLTKTLTTMMIMALIGSIPVMAAPERPERPARENTRNTDVEETADTAESADMSEETIEDASDVVDTADAEGSVAEESAVDTSAPSKDDPDNGYQVQKLDEMGEFIVNTKRSAFNNCQINFSCMIPEGFTMGVILEMENVTENLKFRMLATNSNKYMSRMSVPAGDYHILNCYVDGDTVMEYPMVLPEDFYIDERTTYTIETTLKNYADIEEEANKRLHPELYEAKEAEAEAQKKEANTDTELPWRRLTHTGSGEGYITIKYKKPCAYSMALRIVITAGGDKRAEYKYSTDGGNTWSDVFVATNGSEVPIVSTISGMDSNLTMKFYTTGGFVEGDEYSADFDIEYEYETLINVGQGNVSFASHDVIYGQDYKVDIKMIKSGYLGEGGFIYKLNGGEWSQECVIPENGQFEIPGTQIIVKFWADTSAGNTFLVSDAWECSIKGDMSQRSMVPYFAGIIGLLAMAGFGIVYNLRRQKTKPWEYTLNVYKPIELPQRKRK